VIGSRLWPLVARLLAALGVICIGGLLARLILQLLQPILPPQLMAALSAGWEELTGQVPVAPLSALVLLVTLTWIAIGRNNRS
jgi:hypothetical protein